MRKWTEDEFRKMRQMADRGFLSMDVAYALGRSDCAVRNMARVVGIRFTGRRQIQSLKSTRIPNLNAYIDERLKSNREN